VRAAAVRVPAGSRLSSRRSRMNSLLVGAIVVVVLLVLLAQLLHRPSTAIPCGLGNPCSGVGSSLITGEIYTSPLGFSFEYDPDQWTVRPDGSGSLIVITSTQSDVSIQLQAAPTSESSPDALLQSRLSEIERKASLAADCVVDADLPGGGACPHPEHEIFGAALGYVRGLGGAWAGASDVTGRQLSVILMAAGDQRLSLMASVQTGLSGDPRFFELVVANGVLNSIRWEP
jgi:hypothetical protein